MSVQALPGQQSAGVAELQNALRGMQHSPFEHAR
jgi:hypothetical protein